MSIISFIYHRGARGIRHALTSLGAAILVSSMSFIGYGAPQQQIVGQSAPETLKPAIVAPTAGDNESWAAKGQSLVTEFDVNGLRVLVKRREGSQTVAAGLFIRGGARNLTSENAGIEALMLDASTEASASFPRERMRAEQARIGTALSYSANYDYSALTLTATRPHFERSWEMFTDVALRPSFDKEDFARVKNRLIISSNDDMDEPDSHLQLLQERAAYAGHPYFNRPSGTAASLGRVTLEDLRRHHKEALQTSRLLLVIVGDFDPARLKERVIASFGKLPRGNYAAKELPPLEFAAPTVAVTPQETLKTNYVQGVFSAPSLTSDDIYAMRIASSILRDRVFEEVRNKRQLSYAPRAFLSTQGANVGGIYVSAVDANQAVGVMIYEIGRLQRDPVTAQDLSAIVAQYLTNYYLSQETNAAQAGELATYELIGGGWKNAFQFIDRLRAVAPRMFSAWRAPICETCALWCSAIRRASTKPSSRCNQSINVGRRGRRQVVERPTPARAVDKPNMTKA
ncbi:MAG: pitrilysin family protein [Pyrinomonadaceae bacterium]